MKVPANIISENLYTIGKEFVLADSYKEYQGYYYEINDKFFAGEVFDPFAPRLLKLDSSDIDPLRLDPKTSVYAGLRRTRIPTDKIPSIPLDIATGTKYLAKQIGSNPVRIIFTTEKAWRESKKYPGYIITSVYFEPEFGFEITNENRKAIPEIDIFLEDFSNEI